MYKKKYVYLLMTLLFINSYAEEVKFNIFSNKIEKPKIEKTPEIPKEEKQVVIVDQETNEEINFDNDFENKEEGKISNYNQLSTEDFGEVTEEELKKIKKEFPKLKQDYLDKKKYADMYLANKKYEKEIKKIYIDKKDKFLSVYIPVEQITELMFDKVITKLEYLPQESVEIIWNKEKENQKIKIKNLNPLINMNLKIIFYDDQKINLEIKSGNEDDKKFIEYEFFTNKNDIQTLQAFEKKIKVTNIHDYFNSVSIKIILDYLLKKGDYENIVTNLKQHNKVILSDKYKIQTANGIKDLDYKLTLLSSFQTPYINDNKEGEQKKLVMLFLNLENKSKEDVFVINETFIKERFSNYTAFFIGNILKGENKILPNQSKNLIIIIETKVKE